jgi:hypothetical protein
VTDRLRGLYKELARKSLTPIGEAA